MRTKLNLSRSVFISRREAGLLIFCFLTFLAAYTLNLANLSSRHFRLTAKDRIYGEFPERRRPQLTILPLDLPPNERVTETVMNWGSKPPTTKVLASVHGWVMLESAYILNGTVYLVYDTKQSRDRMEAAIAMMEDHSQPWRNENLTTISLSHANDLLGGIGGRIAGQTWLYVDALDNLDEFTLVGFWRVYTSQFIATASKSLKDITLPRRLISNRISSEIFHFSSLSHYPYRALFPTLTLAHKQDWEDYAGIGVPYLLDHILIGDRSAAAWDSSFDDYGATWSSPFSLTGSIDWWEPVRQNVLAYLDLESASQPKKPLILYFSSQDAEDKTDIRLKTEDHAELMTELRKIRECYFVEMPLTATRTERIKAALSATIILGAYRGALADSLFILRNLRSTIIEFFPPGVFNREIEVLVRSIGVNYVAWQHTQEFISPNLPPTTPTTVKMSPEVPIVPSLVAKSVREWIALKP